MSRLKAYLIDDNTLFVIAASRFLTDFCGVEVVGVAQSAGEAFERISELQPDVVLVDQNLPGMSGLEAAARLKADANGPAVVIVTLNATAELRARAVRTGCDGFVSKVEFTAEIPGLIELLASKRQDSLGASDATAYR
jgi:DNA-binding NarL/FixJ family response regulator